MTKKRTEYSESFKAEAIAKIKENNNNVSLTAKELGIPMQTLANWRRSANGGTLAGTDNYSPNLVALQAENKVTSAVKYGIKHLVDIIRQPDGKSLGILEQVI